MCGRFVAVTDPDGLSKFFVIDDRKVDDLPPSWNVAPTQDVYAVVEHRGERLLTAFRWGLIPHWADDPRIGGRMINARSESAVDKPAFRTAFERRRCLIPADGFYEWKRSREVKVPYYLHSPEGEPLALAGLWETWRDPAEPDAPLLRTCTILTTPANAVVRPLHDRMPAVLPRDAWDAWLDRDQQDAEAARALLDVAPDDLLVAYAVSSEVNNHRNNHAGLLDPVEAA